MHCQIHNVQICFLFFWYHLLIFFFFFWCPILASSKFFLKWFTILEVKKICHLQRNLMPDPTWTCNKCTIKSRLIRREREREIWQLEPCCIIVFCSTKWLPCRPVKHLNAASPVTWGWSRLKSQQRFKTTPHHHSECQRQQAVMRGEKTAFRRENKN